MIDAKYQSLLNQVMNEGQTQDTRNGRTRSLHTQVVEFTSTPLISIRQTAWKNALREMEWFLSGSILLEDLHPDVRRWWEPWADESGAVRNSYGHQLRKAMGHEPYTTYDQIAGILNQLSSGAANGSRRLVLSTWNALDMAHPTTPITNCHGTVIQLFTGVDEGGNKKLDMTTYQRSADLMLGVPHNWLQYWALFKWLAYSTGYEMGKLTWIGGDVHVYQEHWSTAQELIGIPTREIETPNLMWLGMHGDEFYADQFQLTGPKYQPILKCKLDLVV